MQQRECNELPINSRWPAIWGRGGKAFYNPSYFILFDCVGVSAESTNLCFNTLAHAN